MCLHEMTEPWSWSLRAIRSLHILSEDWSVNEKPTSATRGELDNPQDRKLQFASDLPDSSHRTPAHMQDVSCDINDGILGQLMDFDSFDLDIDSMAFDQHLWPADVSYDLSGLLD